ncbi:hypothetical protein CCMSSC00406_0005072 [Pleurotus cornucopiae]|uniref:Uncharacterized protein n=1 Tax=Pleurotus cornucopiae TaxID=5321 RepID=A0ACB7JA60_PLECO|nr:hypothetical protein CCMSSC00406_0005072 [Pleurotus cornucopiae]
MKSIASYPNEIPALTSVPSWAYLNIEETNDIWDLPRAQGLVGAPESTGSPIPRSTATESTTTATEAQNTFSSGVPTPTTTASQRSSGVNAGAIAGGVVGGVAFLAIVAVIGFWYSLRRKQRNEETEVNVFESHLPTSSATPYNTAVASGSVMQETPGHRSQQGSIVSLNTYSPPITDRTNSSSYFMSPTSPATSAAYTTFDPAPNIYVMWRQFGSRTVKGQHGQPGPCELAAKKDEACSRGGDLRPFLSNDLHIPPQSHLGNDTFSWCRCSPIAYSLAVACAKCQSKEAPKWDTWTTGCKKPLDIRLHPAVGNLLKIPVEAFADISRIGHTPLSGIFCGHGQGSSASSASSTSSPSSLTTSAPHHSSTDISVSSTLTSSPTLSTDTFSSANISSTDATSISATTSLNATTTSTLLSSTPSTSVTIFTSITTASGSQTSTNETSTLTSSTPTGELELASGSISHVITTLSPAVGPSSRSRTSTTDNAPTSSSQQIKPPSQNRVPTTSRPPTASGVAPTATVTTPPQSDADGALDVSPTHSSKSSARQQVVVVVSSSSATWWTVTSSSTNTIAPSSAPKTSTSSFSRSHIPTLSPTPSQPNNGPSVTTIGHASPTSLDRTSTPTLTPSSSSTVLQSTDDTIKTQWKIAGSVLGVVFAGSIIAAVVLLFRFKRRRRQFAPSAQYARMYNSSGGGGGGGYGSLEGGGLLGGRGGTAELKSPREMMVVQKDLDREHLLGGRGGTPLASQVDLAGEPKALKGGGEGSLKGGPVGEAFTTSRNVTAASLPPRLSIPDSYYNPDSEPCSPAAESSINMYLSPTSTGDEHHTDSNHSSSSPPSAGSSIHRRRHSSIFGGALRPLPLPSVPETSSRA